MSVSLESRRPRILILCYDSIATQELLWPMADELARHAECIFLSQFPSTLRRLRARGFDARSIRHTLGWEHGKTGPLHVSETTLIPLDGCVDYEVLSSSESQRAHWLAQADYIVRRFSKWVDDWQPSLVLAWNGHTLPFKPCLAYARHLEIPIRVLERGFFPDSLFVDREGTNSKSSVKTNCMGNGAEARDQTLSFIEAHIRHYRPIVAQVSERSDDDFGLKQRLSMPDDAILIFIPEQLDYDSNTVLFCRDVATNEALVEQSLSALAHIKDRDIRIVYKPHPENSHTRAYTGPFESDLVKVVQDIPLVQILEGCDFIVTRNSTLGFEGLLFGKRCITLGESIYSGMGISDDVSGDRPLVDVMREVVDHPALTNAQRERCILLVEKLRQHHHYFTRPREDERAFNQALIEDVVRDARSTGRLTGSDPNVMGKVSIQERLAERWWELKLFSRRVRGRLFKEVKRP